MKVTVKCPSQDDYTIQDLDPQSTTLLQIKQQIEQEFGLPAGKQRLIHAGRFLTDDQLLIKELAKRENDLLQMTSPQSDTSTSSSSSAAVLDEIVLHLAVFPGAVMRRRTVTGKSPIKDSTETIPDETTSTLAEPKGKEKVVDSSASPAYTPLASAEKAADQVPSKSDGDGNGYPEIRPTIVYIEGLPYLAVPASMPALISDMQVNVSQLHQAAFQQRQQLNQLVQQLPPNVQQQVNLALNQQQFQGFVFGNMPADGQAAVGVPPIVNRRNVRVHVIRLSPNLMNAMWTLLKLGLFIYIFSPNASPLRLYAMYILSAVIFMFQMGWLTAIGRFFVDNSQSVQNIFEGWTGRFSGRVAIFFGHVLVPLLASLIPGVDQYFIRPPETPADVPDIPVADLNENQPQQILQDIPTNPDQNVNDDANAENEIPRNASHDSIVDGETRQRSASNESIASE